VSANYWQFKEFFLANKDESGVSSLEFSHRSPPAFHTYEQLPYLAMYKLKQW
jgi:hypothetical protein